MKKLRVQLAAVVATASVGGVVGAGVASGGGKPIDVDLVGYEEMPSVSTKASGDFRAKIRPDAIDYELSYRDLEGEVTQAHIHLGQRAVNGGVSAFLCSNLEGAPAGVQRCPASPATIRGTIRPADVVGPAAQGIAPGEFDELVAAIRAGVTYANVHSTKFPNGEIRGQLEVRPHGH